MRVLVKKFAACQCKHLNVTCAKGDKSFISLLRGARGAVLPVSIEPTGCSAFPLNPKRGQSQMCYTCLLKAYKNSVDRL